MDMLDKEAFIFRLKKVKYAPSKIGTAGYQIKRVDWPKLVFIRDGKTTVETINIDKLFLAYTKLDFIDTKKIIKYISGGVYSPAVAILIASGLYDEKGYRKNGSTIETNTVKNVNKSIKQPPAKKEEKTEKQKDEERFFVTLEQIIGKQFLYAKVLKRPVNKSFLFLSKNYLTSDLPAAINACYQELFTILLAKGPIPNGSLEHNIDGFISNHPQFGNRIIEFDEEQHFTPARYYSLKAIQKHVKAPYQADYIALAKNLDYFNSKVCRKLRIKGALSAFPTNYDDFVKWVGENKSDGINGYIKKNETFQYIGGRISQRAYYDSLRDVAHLMEPNKGKLDPAIRISQYQIETEHGMDFNKIPAAALKKSIENILNYYKL
jgi:hypothetical protein